MNSAPPSRGGVLVAAGQGRRMGTDKVWMEVIGRPVWRWSLDAMLAVPGVGLVAVVVPAGAGERFAAVLAPGQVERCRFVEGGPSRADSVRAGLQALADSGLSTGAIILVHDAARPAADSALMAQVADAADAGVGAIPALPLADSLKRVRDGMLESTVDRAELFAAQTPQAASLGILRASLDAARAAGWDPPDEAAALAAIGVPVRAVAGDPANLKMTEPADAGLLRAVLRGRGMPPDVSALETSGATLRVGIGVDAHRWQTGRPLYLGGLAFPAEPRGLAGHSDGDAVLHAVIDALLGAAGLGDIGTLFPSETDAFRDADSGVLLRDAAARVRAAGWEPHSVDVAVGADRPAIAPRRDEMSARIADLTGLHQQDVSVRGTTTDGLGFAASEGLAAWAVVVLERVR